MTYSVAVVAGIAGALVLDLVVLRTRLVRRRAFWASYPIVLAFQLLFNGILTTRGVVRYDPDAILGARVVGAPVEDLGFGFALVLTTLSLWVWWDGAAGRRIKGPGAGASGASAKGHGPPPPSPGRR